ncbi:hypothetical protein IMZ11_02560 [Microtetraspora sp. AC03309]|uniref:hypothetical protein n=1 Tax=Microtetraspora sp. AC03309 TaxID=2779376 RepID=UPI001E53510A|nr:hypothetical protein [Microtetraspora sp. AC03309]MCC5574521.1 hypothetical protein [Microtetraspora sp. AC03309]
MILAVIAWMDGPNRRQEALGPFEAREDHSHLAEIDAALQAWQAEHGEWSDATLYSLVPRGALPLAPVPEQQ